MTLPEIEAQARAAVHAKWLDSPTYDLCALAVEALSAEGRLVGAYQAEERARLEALVAEQASELVQLRTMVACDQVRELLASAEAENRALKTRVVELESRPAAADVAAWLSKKAREYEATPKSRRESAPDWLVRLSEKVLRGAIRPVPAPVPVPASVSPQVVKVRALIARQQETTAGEPRG